MPGKSHPSNSASASTAVADTSVVTAKPASPPSSNVPANVNDARPSAASSSSSDSSPLSASSLLPTVFSSCISGMIARIPLHPIDTVKAKMQVQQQFKARIAQGIPTEAAVASAAAAPFPTPTATPASSASFVSLFRHTLKHEGVRGLYSGFGVTFFGSAPAVCLYFSSYEYSKSLLTSLPFFHSAPTFLSHFISGLLAETFSCVLWVPIDVVKERLQVQQQLREMMMKRGKNVATGAAAAASLSTTHVIPSTSPSPFRSSASAAATATAASSTAASPVRLSGPSPPALLYRGNLDALVTIARTEGVRGVYRGYGATVASFGPFSAIYLSGYEQFKALATNIVEKRRIIRREARHEATSRAQSDASSRGGTVELPFYAYALSGAAAGGVASVLTNPLDLVKLRLQVQRGTSGTFTFGYRNVLHGLLTLVKQEGVKALFKGATARCAFHIPSTALTIAMFDSLRNYFVRWQNKKG